MSYPVDVPPSPAIAGHSVTTAIVAQSRSTSATDLARQNLLTQTIPSPLPPETTTQLNIHPATTVSKNFLAADVPVQPSLSQPESLRFNTDKTPTPALVRDRVQSIPAKPETPLPPSEIPLADTTDKPTGAPPETTSDQADQPKNPEVTPTPPAATDSPSAALKAEGIIELLADQQNYERERQVFTAEGNVSMRFRNSLVVADRLQVNLINRFAVATGNVTLTRGEQILQGDRFEYNFVQSEGKIRGARGEIFIPGLRQTETRPLSTDISAGRNIARPIGERIYANQPPQNVQSGGGLQATIGSRSNTSGQAATGTASGNISRLRFEADTADFSPEGLIAENVRITNDPFSPPELELRSPKVVVTRLSPLRDEIKAEKPRLVFDQKFKLPLFRNRVVIDRRRRNPALVQIGFDSDERGGLFFGRNIDVISAPNWRFTVTPQFLVQRAIVDGFGASAFGLRAKLEGNLGPRSSIQGTGSLSSLDLSEADDRFRGSLRAQQLIGTHTLSLEASYRDRLFNNSLGFQNVRSSFGFLFYSPAIPIAKTGIVASYQLGYQRITANTDRLDLLDAIRPNDRISLNRFQGSVALSRGFNLWRGKPLPATPTQGLRYTPIPLVPYLNLGVGVTATTSLYSNRDFQRSINGSISLTGQLGHSAKNTLDYTAFNVTYTNGSLGGISPFLFDRAADTQVLFAGITQQIYGPWRLGFQTAWNLDTGNEISTDYLIEYSRRTHSLLLRYNPIQKLGSISFRISDFNWTGGSEAFGGSGVRPVTRGIAGSRN
ncbi:DUF3769 domain-containing protein [filamentous cyanobacterium LEGE 11480]|uniref:DUF3769 domain-containing protein n=1 Tax=Romeriopsis navalis LEGE 11480 TaxID=2777977 RepID=A0A928Z5G4_9CYAN|nr:DUF3769 domain-containing protein [Romeriopsis navalis]MBE9031967.1 DUF3769 domain-containing protein [Romeriopsis navalis LEGE 11480]